jgi:tRNA(adenine34) deaminase
VSKLIYGCDDPKAGAVRTLFQLCEDSRLNHRVEVIAGVLADESARLLQDFFREQRAMGKK